MSSAVETNVVRMAKGSKTIGFRITKHADGSVSAEMSRSIAWQPIGGLRAARNKMEKLMADGFVVVKAS